MYKILSTEEYLKWFFGQSVKTQGQIQARLERIKDFGHFGDARHLGKKLAELKWKNGLRIYFSLAQDENGNVILILVGGNKHSQKKDIQMAKKLLFQLSHKD